MNIIDLRLPIADLIGGWHRMMSVSRLNKDLAANLSGEIGNRQLAIGNRGLRPSSVQVERELEVLSQIMDNQFRLPILGWRFGLNAIIDLIPEFGDIATTIVALYIMVSAVRYRVPKITLLRMGLNIGIYFIGGLIPLAGDLFDAWWKPNIRNLNLLRKRATVSAEEARQGRTSDWVFVAIIIGTLLTLLFGSVALSILFFWYVANNLHLAM